jgi:DNA polymerase-1
LPLLVHAGVEADDVIGTVAVGAAAAGWRVVVCSSDKDFTQLVSERISVYDQNDNELDAAAVKVKMGVEPGLVADLLALMGDKVRPCVAPVSAFSQVDLLGACCGGVGGSPVVSGRN